MKHILSIITFILMSTSIHASDDNTLLLKEGEVTIVVENHLFHPLYQWPGILQNYKSQRNVTFNGDTVNKVSANKSE